MTDQPKEKEPSQTMIYVSNLPFTTTDEQLRELFKGHDIKTAYIAKRRNGRSKGFGFVNLVKESEQNAAISKVDGKEIDGRKITAKIAFNDPRRNDQGELREEFKTNLPKQGASSDTVVYVANIPWTFKDEELKGVFSGLDVKLATVATRRNGRSKGFGFVEFGTKEACVEALKKDQLKVFSSDPTPQERIITVRASHNYRGNQPRENDNQQPRGGNRGGDNRRRQGGGGGQRDNNRGRSRDNNRRPTGNSNQDRNPPRKLENTLYVSNIPFDLDDNDLKQIFSEFHVKSSHVATRQNGKSRGFGFVEFNNAKDQNEALNALNQSEVNNRVITVRVATGQRTPRENDNRRGGDNNNRRGGDNRRGGSRDNNRRGGDNNNRRGGDNNNRRNENRERAPQQPREPREPSTTMVYVSNLPFSVDDNELSGIFKGLKVTNGYVSKRRNGNSRGYGFVTFASQEEQKKALALNNTTLKDRQIVVQIANAPNTTTTTTPQTN